MTDPVVSERDPALIKLLSTGGMRPRVAMRGKSMLPLLREGMVLELAAFDRATVRVGGLVVFRQGSRIIAHRVVATFADGTVRTSGDAQPWIYENVAAIDVLATIAAVYEDDGPSARRIDDAGFRRRGELYARLRSFRIALLRPREVARVAAGLMPWNRSPLFEQLHAVSVAFMRRDPVAVARVLANVDENSFVGFVRRHSCEPLVRDALSFAQKNDPDGLLVASVRGRRLADALQAEARLGALRNIAITEQVEGVVRIFQASGVPFALLKGAARLYARDPDAVRYPSRDIDVFVEHGAFDAASAALCAAGYFYKADVAEQKHYRMHLHHGAPLYPPGEKGWIVEIHTRLARPGWLSTPTHWEVLAAHLRPIDGRCGAVLAFDEFGTVLHHLVHGVGLRRYRDVFVAARAFAELSESERMQLARIVSGETRDPVRFAAMLALVAETADRAAAPIEAPVRAYLAWVRKRESLPRSLRRGDYLLEAWYASAGRPRAIVPLIVSDEGSPVRNVARVALSPVTWLYARALRA